MMKLHNFLYIIVFSCNSHKLNDYQSAQKVLKQDNQWYILNTESFFKDVYRHRDMKSKIELVNG